MLTILIFFGMTKQAFAYLDPGTGSIILQAIAGALVGISLFWSSLKFKVKSFFNSKKENENIKN